jgi:hypothetical protein
MFNSMPTWAKVILRSVGILNCALLLLGLSFLAESVYRTAVGQIEELGGEPYFYAAFVVMATVEIIFVGVFFVASIRFIRGSMEMINQYSIVFAVYVATGLMWRIGSGIGASIAAVSGVTSATAPFAFLLFFLHPMPFPLYPAVTVILIATGEAAS